MAPNDCGLETRHTNLESSNIVQEENNNTLEVEVTSEIVAAYVSNNPLAADNLPGLIQSVHNAVKAISGKSNKKTAEKKTPAVPIKQSVHEDYIICLEDGQKFKSLKRHLRSHYDLSPQEYREKWGLPYDYPMVAASYAKKRSQLARDLGLGRKPGSKIKKAAS